MNNLLTIPAGTTRFKGYDKPRMTRSKDSLVEYNIFRGNKYNNEICSICKLRRGLHFGGINYDGCPSYQILQK